MILITGGKGILAGELKKYFPKAKFIDKEEQDITKPIKIKKNYEMVIHCAAYTDVVKAEKEPEECYKINFWGTANLAEHFKGIPFVYISTEYIYNPCNVYAWSKLAGEKVLYDPYLIIRTLFKPRPYPWDVAFCDQYTTGDYIDIIAKIMSKRIKEWDRKTSKAIDISTGRKTIYQLARMTKPFVVPNSVDDIKSVILPKDYL